MVQLQEIQIGDLSYKTAYYNTYNLNIPTLCCIKLADFQEFNHLRYIKYSASKWLLPCKFTTVHLITCKYDHITFIDNNAQKNWLLLLTETKVPKGCSTKTVKLT